MSDFQNQIIPSILRIFSLEKPASLPEEWATARELLRNMLIEKLKMMIDEDFSGLLNLLYRIDINEDQLKRKLTSNGMDEAAEIMAEMIIDRELEKLRSRQKFQEDNTEWEFDV